MADNGSQPTSLAFLRACAGRLEFSAGGSRSGTGHERRLGWLLPISALHPEAVVDQDRTSIFQEARLAAPYP